jgi:putative PEP-CTERM system histidine kinase
LVLDIGYGLTAIGYLGLLFLLLFVRKSGLAKKLLIAATFFTFGWSVIQIESLGFIKSSSQFALIDSMRLWIWMLFLAACLQNQFSSFWQLISRPLTIALLVVPSAAIAVTSVVNDASNYGHLILTLLTIQMLVILEQVYRQSGQHKWEYKPLVIYLASLTTFDFFTYANAAMVAQINMNFFAARGFIFLAMLPFLVLAIRRIQHWGIDIFVSREVVMHSTLLMLSGAYLVVMALLGYLVQFMGGNWSAPIQLVLFLVAVVLLLSLFLSNEFRTKLKVFITKNFYANQFDYRVEWLTLTQTLSLEEKSLPEVYKTALKGWVQGIKYDRGVLLKLNNKRFTTIAELVDDGTELPKVADSILPTLATFLSKKNWIIDVDEMRIKPDLYVELPNRNDLIKSFDYQFIVPIYQQQALWGLVFLQANNAVKRTLNWELRDYLQAVTEQTANFIFQAESSQALTENAQFAAFSRMSAFVVHDLKNVLAQINLLLANAKQHKDNPEFIDDTFETLEHTKARMDKMLKQLMDKSVDKSDIIEQLDMRQLLADVIEKKCSLLKPIPVFHAETAVMVVVNADKFANVIYHLISNAQQATKEDGTVDVKLYYNEEFVIIDIVDDGIGMSQSFIDEELFKPFVTTKGNAGMGVGAYDAKTYLESIGGSINVTSQINHGSKFQISIPNTAEQADL